MFENVKSVVKQLDKNSKSKEEVVEFQDKLQNLGFVDYVRNLDPEQQKFLEESSIKNFIPWHCVWNKNSVTTPCRMVFNASHGSRGKRSLNSILAKGVNSMNCLLEIVLRWSIHMVAYHTDVQKMYNAILLHPAYWCYQRYWWQEGLNSDSPIEEKVIKTLIYGIKPSGNQAERALRLTATKMEAEYPKAANVMKKDTYVDDCMSGDVTIGSAMSTSEDIKHVLLHGGFKLKGFTFSGEYPPENLSGDGKSIKVAGMRWFSKEDKLQLCVGELVFEKKKQGKVNVDKVGLIPEKVTRRQCVGKVAEIFDLLGKLYPCYGRVKIRLK